MRKTFTQTDIDAAVLVERERCATIAETISGEYDARSRENDPPTPRQIAAAIRNLGR